jgi:hypothetical protein
MFIVPAYFYSGLYVICALFVREFARKVRISVYCLLNVEQQCQK